MKVCAASVSSEASLLGEQAATFSLCPHVIFSLCSYSPALSLMDPISLYKDINQIALEPTLTVSFSLSHLFKGLISKYSHILRCCGLGLQYRNLGKTQFNPNTSLKVEERQLGFKTLVLSSCNTTL